VGTWHNAVKDDHIVPTQNWRISELILERFKAAFQPEPIQLRQFNVIIGRNGSGKSTLLEALQWLDTTIRTDAREASERYRGIHDLMNLRSRTRVPYFELSIKWQSNELSERTIRYRTRVTEEEDLPRITIEELEDLPSRRHYISTTEPGARLISDAGVTILDADRLALATLAKTRFEPRDPILDFLGSFWARAVFLRLSPNRLATGSLATRRSIEPLLDEEGQNLPALLNELSDDERQALVESVREILSGIRGVLVSKAELGRDTRVHYSLLERMPYRGRAGMYQFPIPAWMLSEGTRRLTAILALLVRRPGPSILCIEEIENGLDPWTVRAILRHLQDAADNGTQVLVTTHSPWVLDEVPIESILLVRRLKGDTRYDPLQSIPEMKSFDPRIPPGTRYVQLSE
jgi:predicted ATPase